MNKRTAENAINEDAMDFLVSTADIGHRQYIKVYHCLTEALNAMLYNYLGDSQSFRLRYCGRIRIVSAVGRFAHFLGGTG